jgi:dihydroxyacetone kinase
MKLSPILWQWMVHSAGRGMTTTHAATHTVVYAVASPARAAHATRTALEAATHTAHVAAAHRAAQLAHVHTSALAAAHAVAPRAASCTSNGRIPRRRSFLTGPRRRPHPSVGDWSPGAWVVMMRIHLLFVHNHCVYTIQFYCCSLRIRDIR